MELIIALVLFVGLVASWIVLPGTSAVASASEEPAVGVAPRTA